MEPTGPYITDSGVSRSGAAHRLAPLLQLPLDHLAGGVAGQFVYKDDLPRDLVAGQVLLDVVLDVVLGHLAARAQDDERPQALAELLVVDADRGRLLDRLVAAEELLHLGREHVLPAGDDHLVVAAVDEQTTPAVEMADVARRHEALQLLLGLAPGIALKLGAVA